MAETLHPGNRPRRRTPGVRPSPARTQPPTDRVRRRILWLAGMCLAHAIWFIAASPATRAAEGRPQAPESELKAALVVQLARRFVTWPDSAFKSTSAPFEIGVLGTSPFEGYLDRQSAGKQVGEHPIRVRYAAAETELAGCHVIFIAANRKSPLQSVVKLFEGKPTLLVGEEPGFAEKGGMVNLLIKDQKPFLQIHGPAAESVGLRFSGALGSPRNIEWIGKAPRDQR